MNEDSMEALTESLGDLGLFLVQIEGWIVIQRTTFDTHVEGEPFQSMQLYADPAAKKYLVRVWGRTVKAGEWKSVHDVRMLCESYFARTAVCTGYPGTRPDASDELVRVDYPCPRWISKACWVLFSQSQSLLKSEDTTVGLCAACSGTSFTITKVAKTKPELPEEEETLKKPMPSEPKIPKENITITKVVKSESDVPGKVVLPETEPPADLIEDEPEEPVGKDAQDENTEPKADGDLDGEEVDGAVLRVDDGEDWAWPLEVSNVETPTQVCVSLQTKIFKLTQQD